ncbi:MAG: tetratricopeptide repeat protein [bacterium]|nr:tetratricopeptide repeat protein [bacterium]
MKIVICALLFTASLGLVIGPDPAVANELGEALGHYYRGDHRAAVDALKMVIDADPGNAAAYYYLGYTYQEMGMYIAARAAFKKTYEINPDFVPVIAAPSGSQNADP